MLALVQFSLMIEGGFAILTGLNVQMRLWED